MSESVISQTSVSDGGIASAPTAGTAIATVAAASLPVGVYEVNVWIGANGTLAAATDTSNFNFKAGTTTVSDQLVMVATGTSNPAVGPFRYRLALDGSTNLTVNAVISSTAGSRYTATIIATKVN